MTSLSKKKFIAKLQKEDPEFYATILASKDILDQSDDDESDDANVGEDHSDSDDQQGDHFDNDIDDIYDEEDTSQSKPKGLKKSKKDIEDDDDDDVDDEAFGSEEDDQPSTAGQKEITPKLVKLWRTQLQGKRPEEAFRNVSVGLVAAIDSLDCKEAASTSRFIVTSPSVFNMLVHTALQHMSAALRQMLGINNLAHITTSKKFKKYTNLIKTYMQNMLKLHDCITDPNMREVVLRHGVLPLLACYKVQPKQSRQFIKKLVGIWATGHTKLRVLAFLALFRLVKMMGSDVLDYTLKTMYLNYVQNCRFTSPNSLGCICFMRLSLTELYALDHGLAYRHAFVYIRQMAFHLRNAIVANKKEKLQLVYNWQFMHCLHLWCTLLGTTHPTTVLEPLVYPVVQMALGTIKLQPSPRFFPLMLHVCGMLTELSSATAVFIPVLPFIVKVLTDIKDASGKKLKEHQEETSPNWNCVLKLSEGEVSQDHVLRSLMKEAAVQLTRYLATEAHSIAFPELVVPAVIALKKCAKRKNSCYPGLARLLVTKITEQAEFIENRRKDVPFQLKDRKQLQDWETATKQERLPIVKFSEKFSEDSDIPLRQKRKMEDEPSASSNKKRKTGKKSTLKMDKIATAKEKVSKLSLSDL